MNPTLKGLDQWPNTSSLPPSSHVEAFSEPGRVETAEDAFQTAFRDAERIAEKQNSACLEFMASYRQPDGEVCLYSKVAMSDAFCAGFEAGRNVK